MGKDGVIETEKEGKKRSCGWEQSQHGAWRYRPVAFNQLSLHTAFNQIPGITADKAVAHSLVPQEGERGLQAQL